jgi:uncharacterized protein (TIGR02118 family)
LPRPTISFLQYRRPLHAKLHVYITHTGRTATRKTNPPKPIRTANMPATVTVLYPRESDGHFDADYYLKTHMPLAQKNWAPYGFTSYKVIKFGDDAPYVYGVAMDFESMEGVQKAMASDKTKEIMDDVVNYSNLKPTIVAGEVIGTN